MTSAVSQAKQTGSVGEKSSPSRGSGDSVDQSVDRVWFSSLWSSLVLVTSGWTKRLSIWVQRMVPLARGQFPDRTGPDRTARMDSAPRTRQRTTECEKYRWISSIVVNVSAGSHDQNWILGSGSVELVGFVTPGSWNIPVDQT